MFVFNYNFKSYENCPKATARNKMISKMSTLGLYMGILIVFVAVLSGGSEAPAGFLLGASLIGIYFYCKKNKDGWTDKIAAEENGGNYNQRFTQSPQQTATQQTSAQPKTKHKHPRVEGPISAQSHQDYKFCTECGEKNPRNAKFCSACGTKIG